MLLFHDINLFCPIHYFYTYKVSLIFYQFPFSKYYLTIKASNRWVTLTLKPIIIRIPCKMSNLSLSIFIAFVGKIDFLQKPNSINGTSFCSKRLAPKSKNLTVKLVIVK